MKTLANCTPEEFLSQSWKVAQPLTDLIEKAQLKQFMKSLKELKNEDGKTDDKMVKSGLFSIVGELCEKYPKETAKVIGLACFVPENELDKHTGAEFLLPVMQMLGNQDILGFFISLLQ